MDESLVLAVAAAGATSMVCRSFGSLRGRRAGGDAGAGEGAVTAPGAPPREGGNPAGRPSGPLPGGWEAIRRILGMVLRAVGGEDAAEARRELAAWLDLLILEVEAGVGLRRAVEEASLQARGRLRPVLAAVLRDLGMGMTLVEAMEARTATGLEEEWRSLVRGLRLGQRFGTPLADSLRQLAGDLRRRQRQDLELKMTLLPVKLGLWGILFFFPPLLLLLVLPNVLQFLRSPW